MSSSMSKTAAIHNVRFHPSTILSYTCSLLSDTRAVEIVLLPMINLRL